MAQDNTNDPVFELEMAKMRLTNDMIAMFDILDKLVNTATTMEQFNEAKAHLNEKFLEVMKEK